MKIIQVVPMLGLGGAETMCENLTYALREIDHEVIVVSLYDYSSPITKRLEERGVEVRYMHKKRGFDISLYGRLKKLLKDEKPDAINTHLYAAKYIFPIARSVGVKRVVHTVHSVASIESPLSSRIMNRYYFRRGIVIPVSLCPLVQETVMKEYGIKKEKTPVVYNGIDLKKCKKKTTYSINENFKILHIGRYNDVKNHAGLIEAFALFHEKHSNSELQLIGDGELKEKVEAFVLEKGLEKYVHFFGQQSNVFGFLHDADVFTLPSKYEGMPMTLIEAMGSGLPIVSTAVGGIPDMLNDESAQLVDVDVNKIAGAYEKYYLNENLRQKHGVNAYKRAAEFSSKKMAEEYSVLYEKGIITK